MYKGGEMKKIQRDAKKAVKHAKNMDKFGDIVKRKSAIVPGAGGSRGVRLIWDFSEQASQEQVFLLETECEECDHIQRRPIGKQAWEHVARAI
jgi:FlaA1/EpsC-like NDP-sugar epimerase